VELVKRNDFPQPSKLLASPKNRALQTLQPLAEHTRLPLQIFLDLDERSSAENADNFSKRVKKTLDLLSHYGGVVYIVTHLDWLEESLIHIPCDSNLLTPQYHSWSPGQGIEFEIIDGLWTHPKQRRIP
jgi:phosphohistidine phosphatase SixA